MELTFFFLIIYKVIPAPFLFKYILTKFHFGIIDN